MLKRSLLANLGVMVSFLVAHPALGQATLVDAPDTVLVTTTSVDVSWDVLNDTSDSLYLVVSRFFVDTVSPFNYPYGSQPEAPGSSFVGPLGQINFVIPLVRTPPSPTASQILPRGNPHRPSKSPSCPTGFLARRPCATAFTIQRARPKTGFATT